MDIHREIWKQPASPRRRLLFGYGTLRRDVGPESSPPDNAYSLGYGTIPGRMHILASRWAGVIPPQLVPQEEVQRIRGEVWFLMGSLEDHYWKLNQREGYHEGRDTGRYIRRTVRVAMDDGGHHDASVYYVNPEYWRGVTEPYHSGDWLDWVREKHA